MSLNGHSFMVNQTDKLKRVTICQLIKITDIKILALSSPEAWKKFKQIYLCLLIIISNKKKINKKHYLTCVKLILGMLIEWDNQLDCFISLQNFNFFLQLIQNRFAKNLELCVILFLFWAIFGWNFYFFYDYATRKYIKAFKILY